MKCPSCQSENPADSRYCSRCGSAIEETSPTLSYTPAEEAAISKALRFNPGEKFGERYTIIEEIGEGGMGRVYKAADHELGITVVLKMIRPDLSSRPHMVEQFRKETLLGRSISHENVVRIHDLGEINKIKYISMDFIKGENLLELIQTSGTLSLATCLQIAIQVCHALKAAHQKGIVHQDLKPQNIMVDNSGRVFVTDFGLARSLSVSRARPSDKSYGTPKYFSPEQARGQESDQRSDIYSLGAVLYEMTTGTAPFKADTVETYIQKHTTERPAPPSRINPAIPPACEKIILKCLEKKKEDRYQSVDELLRDLEIQKKQSHIAGAGTGIKKWQTAVLTASLTLVLGFVVYRLFFQTPPHPSGRIAVMYAVNNSGDKSLDELLRWQIPYYLYWDLAQSKYLSVLPPDRLIQALEDMKQMNEEHHLSKTLDRIADSANVEYFILPSFMKVGDGLLISFTVRKAKTDETVGEPDSVRGKTPEDLVSMMEEMSLKVKSRLNISPAEIAGDTSLSLGKISTTSGPALRYYIDAEKSYVQRNYEACIQSLEKAVKEDPNFAMAYLNMAVGYEYLSDYDKHRTYLQKALTLLDRASERDRYFIQGYASYALDESPLKAIDSFQKLIERYPQDEAGRMQLGAIRRNLEEWDLALYQFEKVLSLNPKSALALENEVFIYTAKGFYEKAIELCEAGLRASPAGAFFLRQLPLLYLIQASYERASVELEKAAARLPDDIEILELEGNLHHLQGNVPTAQGVYEQLQRRGEADPSAPDLRGRLWLARLLLWQGEYRQAQKGILEGIELAQKSNRLYDEINCRLLLAHSELQLGRFSRAAEALKPALELAQRYIKDEHKIVLHLLGLASLGMGRIEEAKTVGQQLFQLIEREGAPKKMRCYEHLMGQIALAEGRTSQAIRHFEQAISLLPEQRENADEQAFYYDGLAAACYQSGDLTKATKTYRAILSLTTGRLIWGDIFARSSYWLGKILQRNGNNAEAAVYYENFLGLWKKADVGLPEVEDAKEQLQALKKVPQPESSSPPR
jgi:serine/threonine protein kinase/predicted Zn-dependent protease